MGRVNPFIAANFYRNPVFFDTDTPGMPWIVSSGSAGIYGQAYIGNIRVMGQTDGVTQDRAWAYSVGGGPTKYPSNVYRSMATIKQSANVMMMWDAPMYFYFVPSGSPLESSAGNVTISGSTEVIGQAGGVYAYNNNLDLYGFSNGNGDVFPIPLVPKSDYLASPSFYDISFFANQIGLGDTPIVGQIAPTSANPGAVTTAYLKMANSDCSTQLYDGPQGQNICGMRFRHMINSTANVMFADFHVESRLLGTVLAKDTATSR
jgi:prepilin-type processing-associated H-X9-DG protein